MGLWKVIKRFWMRMVDVLGHVQTAVLLSVVYHLAVGPLSLFARLTGRDIMDLKPPRRDGGGSYAVGLKPISSTVERAQRQF